MKKMKAILGLLPFLSMTAAEAALPSCPSSGGSVIIKGTEIFPPGDTLVTSTIATKVWIMAGTRIKAPKGITPLQAGQTLKYTTEFLDPASNVCIASVAEILPVKTNSNAPSRLRGGRS